MQSGERITVTSRGAPVADLVPHAPHGLDPAESRPRHSGLVRGLVEESEAEGGGFTAAEPDDELLRLARAGEVRLGAHNPGVRYTRPPAASRLPHDDVMAILDSVRGDR